MTNDFTPIEVAEAERRAEQLELEFSFDGYQVVRRELFAHLRDPAVTIRRDSITFNNACIEGLEDAVYILLLINPNINRMLIRKCDENDKNALRWCIAKEDSRKSRQITSRDFSEQLYNLLEWDKRNRYKVLGYRIKHEGEEMYIFDLMEKETIDDTKRKDPHFEGELAELNAKGPRPDSERAFDKSKMLDTFGSPIETNQQALQLDSMSGYVDTDGVIVEED